MNTLVWRLHRSQACLAAAALAALTVILLVTGVLMAHRYDSFVATCAAAHTCGESGRLLHSYSLVTIGVSATMAVPLLFGLFWGAPLLAREFEDGTQNLAWTQGVTRRRWLSRTLAWALLAAAGWGAAMAALVTWWRSPDNALGIPGVRLQPAMFDIQGIAPVAYAIFAMALGIAAGAVFRRVLPAMATTLGVFVGLRFVIAEYIRPRYLSSVSRSLPLGAGPTGRGVPADSWVSSTAIVGPNGHHYNLITPADVPAACRGLGPSCLSSRGYHWLTIYQPASRFWAFQGIEAGIFVALAAVLVAVAWRLVLTRDA